MRRLLRKLWNVERLVLVTGDEPLPVAWPMGKLDVELEENGMVSIAVWLPDGRVVGVAGQYETRVVLSTELPAPPMGLHVDHHVTQPFTVAAVNIDGMSQVRQPLPLAALQSRGYVPAWTPRWRVLWDALKSALRWAPVKERPES